MHQVDGFGAGELLQLASRWTGPGWPASITRLEIEQLAVYQVHQVRSRGAGELLQISQHSQDPV